MSTPQTLGELEAWLAGEMEKPPSPISEQAMNYFRTILHGTTCEDCGGSGDGFTPVLEEGPLSVAGEMQPDGGMKITASMPVRAYVDRTCPSCNNGRVGGLRQRLYENADLDRDDGLNIEPALTIELNPTKEEANGVPR